MHPHPVSLSLERREKEGMFIRRPNPDPGWAGGGLPAGRQGSPSRSIYFNACTLVSNCMMVSNICFIAYHGRQLADERYNPVYECISFHNVLTIIFFNSEYYLIFLHWSGLRPGSPPTERLGFLFPLECIKFALIIKNHFVQISMLFESFFCDIFKCW